MLIIIIVVIKPNSRTLLIGEQPNPSKLFHPEDRMKRHRIILILTKKHLNNYKNFCSSDKYLDYIIIRYKNTYYIYSGCWRLVFEG